MLYALSIQSFVLIDHLDLEAANGFTALTGETGAGKSIILDALGLVMGSPADREKVRVGAEQANITAEFSLPPEHPAWDILQCHSIAHRPDEMLILRRTVSRSGPSRAAVPQPAHPINGGLNEFHRASATQPCLALSMALNRPRRPSPMRRARRVPSQVRLGSRPPQPG